jgi:hypothetical protein
VPSDLEVGLEVPSDLEVGPAVQHQARLARWLGVAFAVGGSKTISSIKSSRSRSSSNDVTDSTPSSTAVDGSFHVPEKNNKV